jgi:phosphonate transport system permease protein
MTDAAAWRARCPRAFGPTPAGRALRWAGAAAALAWLLALCAWFDITPARLERGVSGLWVILRQMVPPNPGAQWDDILIGLGQSVAMAFLGTLAAFCVALPLGFLGARNVVVGALAHFSIRRSFDAFRGIDQLIWALAAAEICLLAKLFAEAIENADPRQREAVLAAGGSRWAAIRWGLWPQIRPVLLSQALYAFEASTRGAAVLGVVGAGGIGLQIAERIKIRYWDEVAFIVLLILATVAAIDAVSGRLRRRLMG